eukprot:m.85805 g.85805  ORF g.85805 m.85805 type:complete len:2894 (+) comp9644_c0_seq1:194-8875(+)
MRHSSHLLACCILAAVSGNTASAQFLDVRLNGFEVVNAALRRNASGSSWSNGTAYAVDPLSQQAGVVGVSVRILQVRTQLVGLSDGTESATNLARYAAQMNQFGQVIVSEGTVIRGLFGNYDTSSTVEIVISRAGAIEYYIDGSRVFVSADRPGSTLLRPVVAVFDHLGSIGRPSTVNTSAWCRGVVCQPNGPCQVEGNCIDGVCHNQTAPNGTACNDFNVATVNDQCVGGTCMGTDACASVDCTSVNDDCHASATCFAGLCFGGQALANGTTCSDGNSQTVNDICVGGVCMGTVVTTVAPTSSPTVVVDPCAGVTCPQHDSCHQPHVCNNGQCFIGPRLPNGTVCNDNNTATNQDTCQSGVCVGVHVCQGVECTPTNPCQLPGSCDGSTGVARCTYPSRTDGSGCDDGNNQTTNDACFAGICVGVDNCVGVSCQPLSQCHVSGQCIRGVCSTPVAPSGTPCNDGNSTTVGDSCDNGVCSGVDPCAGVSCPTQTCRNPSRCVGGQCVAGTVLAQGTTCDDGDAATTNDVCDSEGVCTGVDPCSNRPPCQNFTCYEPSLCVRGVCVRGAATEFAACDDGDPGTDNDACIEGLCVGVRNRCFGVNCSTPPGPCRSAGTCNGLTGGCTYPVRPNGTPCDDSNTDTVNDTCVAGTCVGQLSQCLNVTCGAPDQCSESAGCDPFTGQCLYTPRRNGTTCDDNNPRTSNDACQGGRCSGVDLCLEPNPIVCPTPTACLFRNTSVPGGCFRGQCQMIMEDDGTPCDDGNNATGFDSCSSGVCTGINLESLCQNVSCPVSANPCVDIQCEIGQCVESNAPQGRLCDDGNNRTSDDHCTNGICRGTDLCDEIACPTPSSPCVTSNCFRGNCTEVPLIAAGIACSDGNASTVNDTCVTGVCVGTDPCQGVVCPQPSQCEVANECVLGECITRFQPTGTPCSDGNNFTADDVCARGVCRGTPIPCTCPTPVCFLPVPCFNGTCPQATAAPAGTPCNDGDPTTSFDVCNGQGRCSGVNLCQNVTCPEATTCRGAGSCQFGRCRLGSPVTDGTPCDDGRADTDLDVCSNGDCTGVDTCADVTCTPSGPCVASTSCSNATCSETFRTPGFPCNDGDNTTSFDACNAAGQCVGQNLCANVTCQTDQCQSAARCELGRCVFENRANGTACDDGNAATDLDTCLAGRCNGVDLCANVTCAPRDCFQPGTCNAGTCEYSLVPPNTTCVDGQTDTYADACSNGVCRGRLPCSGTCVAWQSLQSAVENTEYGVTRTAGGVSGWTAGGTSIDAITAASTYAGVKFRPAQNNLNAMAGLGYNDSEVHYSTIEYGVFMTLTGRLLVYESGTYRGYLGDYVAGTTIEVRTNRAGSVEYVVDNQVQLTSTVTPSGSPLFVEVSILNAGASIDEFEWVTKQASYCATVSCPTPGQCTDTASVCILGQCTSETYRPPTTPCDDGNIATSNDACLANGTCAGVDLCVGVTCPPLSPNCASPPVCFRGVCLPCQDLCSGVTCAAATTCRSSATCSRGDCIPGDAAPNGTACSDGNVETEDDTCVNGECVGINYCDGVVCDPVVCAQVECIRGTCNVTQYDSAGTACSDGDNTTVNDVCNGAGVCAGVDPCTLITCDPVPQCQVRDCTSGCDALTNAPDGLDCDDGNPATTRDRCNAGQCIGSDPCVERNISCGPEQCFSAGQCFLGSCIDRTPLGENASCSDGDPNTLFDRCNAAGQCVGVDLCAEIVCTTPETQCAFASQCSGGRCLDPLPKADGLVCNDSNPATDNDRCQSGVCRGDNLCLPPFADCSAIALGPCYEEPQCSHGQCFNTGRGAPAGTPCDDGLVATYLDTCNGNGTCVGIDLCDVNQVVCPPPPPCRRPVTCFNGTCPDFPVLPAGASCDDGNADTVGDVCDADGNCQGIDPCVNVTCPQLDCHSTSVCDRDNNGVCTDLVPFVDGTLCDDGDDLSVNDRCERGRCVGTALTCQSVLNGVVRFVNGCGGLNNTGTRWSFNYLQAPCVCTSSQGIAFGDFDARANTPALCAQMICSGGAFNFQRCDYRGVTVATGRRDGNVVTVPFEYEDYICGLATPPVVTSVATTPSPGVTTAPDAPAICGQTHTVTWGFDARNVHLSVFEGDVVRWVWDGDLPLNVRGTWGPPSGTVSYTGDYNATFNNAGQFSFRSDVVFPVISGTITVTARTTDASGQASATVTVSPVAAPSVSVATGSVVAFEWDGNSGVVVESIGCGTMAAGVLFGSGLASLRGSLSVQFNVPGAYRYAVRANGVTLESVVVVTAATTVVTTPLPTTTSSAPTSTSAPTSSPTASTPAPTTATPTVAPTDAPSTASPTAAPAQIDLLNAANHNATSSVDPVGDAVYHFDGQTAISVRSVPQYSSTFSIAMTVSVDRLTSGYLFAFGESTSSTRYFSLQIRQEVTFYYRVDGVAGQLALGVPLVLSTGVETQLLVSVSGPALSLTWATPGSNVTTSRHVLSGPVQRCTGTNCTTLLGARESGTGATKYELSGTIYSATYYPRTLASNLPPSSGIYNFTRLRESSDFNLLLSSVVRPVSVPGPQELGDGSYKFVGGSALALDVAPRSVGTAWTVSLWVRQEVGDNGYLFAKANGNGALRYYGLYSSGSSRRMTFYYVVGGQSRSVDFGASVSDGQFHHIQLVVNHTTVTLQIDASASPMQVSLASSPIQDCGQPQTDCYFHVGQRMSPSGGAYLFRGEIFSARFYHRAFTQPPGVIPAGDPRRLVLVGGASGPVSIDGLTGIRVRSFRAVSSNFSVGCNVSFDASTSTGYLWAKSNLQGTVRTVSLYANRNGFRLYYKPLGASEHSSVRFSAPGLFDGAFHSIVLAVSGQTATMVVDGGLLPPAPLNGPVDDCSAADPDCAFFVGQRSSSRSDSTWAMTGTIASATLHYYDARLSL